MSATPHTHSHAHQVDARAGRRSALLVALGLNVAFLVVEIVSGWVFHSLALVADGVHLFSDVVALGFALFAVSLTARPASQRHTYGFGRAEVVAAQVNAILLLGASGWIAFAAIHQLSAGNSQARGAGIAVVATLGIVVNAVSATILYRNAGTNLNIRGAYLHMAVDTLGSVAALFAGVVIVVWSLHWFDAAASLAVACVAVVGAWRLLRDTTHLLIDAAPSHLDVQQLHGSMVSVAGVTDVHHLHVWSMGSEQVAVSAHVVLDEQHSLHRAQEVVATIKDVLEHDYAIDHATLEVECHPCAAHDENENVDTSRRDVAASAGCS